MAKQSLLSDKTVVFDTETTGLSPLQGHRIIEIGAVLLQGNDIMDEFHSLIDAGVPIDPRAQAVHGITRKMLHGHPRSAEVFADFRDFIGHALLVAHNAPFDTRFLRAEFDQLGFNLPNRIGCSLKMSRQKLVLPNYRLDTVYRHLGGNIDASVKQHRALDDAKMAAFVWLGLNEV